MKPQSQREPGRLAREISEEAFAGLTGQPIDCHVHVLGLGRDGSGIYANPKFLSPLHPGSWLKAGIMLKAAGTTFDSQAGANYIACLRRLAAGFPVAPKLGLLAFDYRFSRNGEPDYGHSDFAIPDSYVLDLAKQNPNLFYPVCSVHPHSPDALTRLESCAKSGVKLVKWLPNAQLMNPADPMLAPFYLRMRELGLALLCHTGLEASVSAQAQQLGNPLLLRLPLELGVKVVAAHAGGRGRSQDLDRPGKKARNFELFMRLMDDAAYKGLLFADISMLTQSLRRRDDLLTLLKRRDLHGRLLNGSDYPLPGLRLALSPGLLKLRGLITPRQCDGLREIFKQNPLLFDFVLKRVLRHPESGERFADSVFQVPGWLAGPNSIQTSIPQCEEDGLCAPVL